MIDIYQASEAVLEQWQAADNERIGIKCIERNLAQYHWACAAATTELDIAFAAAGGRAVWLQESTCRTKPEPPRPVSFADILVERDAGFVHLATPAGFLPLVDVEVVQFQLRLRTLN